MENQLRSLIARLIKIINEEVQSFERLLDLLIDEQRSIVKNDIKALQVDLLDQEQVLSQVRNLEGVRLQLTDTISQKLGIEPSKFTVRKLAKLIEGSQATRLEDIGNTLLDLQKKIEAANRNNELLIKQSMRYINRSLNILTGAERPAPVYASSGKTTEDTAEYALVDTKA